MEDSLLLIDGAVLVYRKSIVSLMETNQVVYQSQRIFLSVCS